MYLTIPSVSTYILEAHPFTIASIDEPTDDRELELSFIVRACDGFTRRLLQKTIAANGALISPMFISGPYGSPPVMHRYEVVLIAGEFVDFTIQTFPYIYV